MLAPDNVVEPSNCLRRARSEDMPVVVAVTPYVCQCKNTPSRGGRSYKTSSSRRRFRDGVGNKVRARIESVLPLYVQTIDHENTIDRQETHESRIDDSRAHANTRDARQRPLLR